MRISLSQVHELIDAVAARTPNAIALVQGEQSTRYAELRDACRSFASGAIARRLQPGDRIAVFLPKQLEAVIALFGTSAAGGTFVPINPVLKPTQAAHIVTDCEARLLVTSRQRWLSFGNTLDDYRRLDAVILVDADTDGDAGADPDPKKSSDGPAVISWTSFMDTVMQQGHRRIDGDMAAILYTSGSTGKPKGVVLSHRNLIGGAESVSTYLENSSSDRLLAILPLSFDAGLSQLTTAFNVGATAVLMDYLLPQDVLRAIDRFKITGLAAVPSLWNRLVQLDWPAGVATCLRYVTNTGGTLPIATTQKLQELLPNTQIFLMYGLTEAFRSTYLPPSQVSRIPASIGKAIPNTDILVINEQGEECEAGEPGELVHRGELVALGYWNDPASTALRFRPAPGQHPSLPMQDLAVWSGDQVVRDEEGYLYFVARKDDLIKTSGYRVSPSEIESLAYDSGLVEEAAALGLPHPMLGQGILLVVTEAPDAVDTVDALRAVFRRELPGFMQPLQVKVCKSLPYNQNGKVDRQTLAKEHATLFSEHD